MKEVRYPANLSQKSMPMVKNMYVDCQKLDVGGSWRQTQAV